MKHGIGIICFTLFLLSMLYGCQQQRANEGVDPQNEQPNIIYILADDLGYGDIGPFGQTKIETPNLNKMAAEGMRLTQHYSGSTVCAPSRSVLMTGLHTGHTPVRGNEERMPIGQYPLPYGVPTVAEILHEAGYATGAFGKWGLGYPGSEGSPSRQGFDLFFGYNDQRRAHFYYPEFLFREVPGQAPERVPLEGNEVIETSREGFEHPGSGPPKNAAVYSQDAIMEEALSFIEENASAGDPFFAYLPLNIPHASITVPEEAMAPYLDQNGESIFEEEPFEGGHYAAQPRPRAAFAGMVTLLDKYVGQVMKKLQDQGIAENTLIIFSSDNGPHVEGGHDPEFFDSNGPLRGVKRDLYEGGIRVPTIAWWPGTVPEGSESGHISAFEDMLPTFAELAGVAAPPNIDGISMAPTLTGNGEQRQREYLYWEFPARGGKQAVRKDQWKAVRLNLNENPNAPIELYNLEEDLSEENNVADQHPDVVKEMRQIMEQAHVRSEVFPIGSELEE
ncbi:arylsulfatase [Aliifodinibius sp. S!AR15-10]|uniref:arylsulfatase n=1 Tax=Aliifodinibius sp. S!AR15-10 TaxID=2950437 RepID=UPI00285FA122|nr:arylsulfatase [Aliifodinibius sp. S!AR15-10]MDR8391362.1 arylsulfatase [Aliifodinibius sp. S!AR15-10]